MSSAEDTAVADDGSEADAAEAVEEATDERREELASRFHAELGDAIVQSHIAPGHELWLRVTNAAWFDAGQVARHSLGFGFFDFLSAIDWMPSPYGREMDAEQDTAVHGAEPREKPPMETGVAGGDSRFQVIARVHSVTEHIGIIFKVDLPGDQPSVQSWVRNYAGADWHEREAWEMFGIEFVGHPGLRHLYLPGQFEGNPLRKDFPLLARRVKPWPGIVDVEGMPGDGDEADGAEDGS